MVAILLSVEMALLAALFYVLIFKRHWLGIRPRAKQSYEEWLAAEYQRRKHLRDIGRAG